MGNSETVRRGRIGHLEKLWSCEYEDMSSPDRRTRRHDDVWLLSKVANGSRGSRRDLPGGRWRREASPSPWRLSLSTPSEGPFSNKASVSSGDAVDTSVPFALFRGRALSPSSTAVSSPAGGRSHSAASSLVKGVALPPASPALVKPTLRVTAPSLPGTGGRCIRPALVAVGNTDRAVTDVAGRTVARNAVGVQLLSGCSDPSTS